MQEDNFFVKWSAFNMFDSFLFFFSLRSGSACMSSMCLFMGLLGGLLAPFLPYSVNEDRLILVMLYMLLLIFGFGSALCGVLNYSKSALRLGFFLAILAFLYWVFLTFPTLTRFNRVFDHEYCLGDKCGESHWFVPRQWDSSDFSDPLPDETVDQYFDDYLNLKKQPPFPDYIIRIPEDKFRKDKDRNPLHPDNQKLMNEQQKLMNEILIKKYRMQLEARKGNQSVTLKPMNLSVTNSQKGNNKMGSSKFKKPLAGPQPYYDESRLFSANQSLLSQPYYNESRLFSANESFLDILSHTSTPTTTLKAEDVDWMELADELLARDERSVDNKIYPRQDGLPSSTIGVGDGDLLVDYEFETPPKYMIFKHDHRYTGRQNSVIRYDKTLTFVLAWLYCYLFLCAIVTLYLHLWKFSCPKVTTQCTITRPDPRKSQYNSRNRKRSRGSVFSSSSCDIWDCYYLIIKNKYAAGHCNSKFLIVKITIMLMLYSI